MRYTNSFWKMTVIACLIFAISFASMADLAVLFYPRPAQAQLSTILSALGGEDSLDTGCSMGGIAGDCVPILLQSDPKRGTNNNIKNILTSILYGATIAFGKWMQHSIDSRLGIRDYYGYNRSLKDVIYKYRILFETYLDPDTRRLADIAFETVLRGQVDYNQVKVILNTRSTNVFSEVRNPIVPSNPDFYTNLALSGQWGASPYDQYHIVNDQAFANQSESAASAAQEVSQSQGYKSSRTKADLAALTAPKNQAFYSDALKITPSTGQIVTPGFVAAKALQISMQKLMEHYKLTTNTTAAVASEIALDLFFSLPIGQIFKKDTAAVGNTTQSDTFYKNGAITDTGSALNMPPPAAPLPNCNIDSDGDGANDSIVDSATGMPTTNCTPTPTSGIPNCDTGTGGTCTTHSSGAACISVPDPLLCP